MKNHKLILNLNFSFLLDLVKIYLEIVWISFSTTKPYPYLYLFLLFEVWICLRLCAAKKLPKHVNRWDIGMLWKSQTGPLVRVYPKFKWKYICENNTSSCMDNLKVHQIYTKVLIWLKFIFSIYIRKHLTCKEKLV